MGVVYKARDPQIDRLVALKTVPLRGQDPDAEKEFRLRFQHEAQAAGRLHHPGIVAIFDVGEESETKDPYIVMEYVAGEALNRVLAREKKLALETALQLTEEVAEALDYAHGQGVTHRDIKPGNILVTRNGRAKIADFGIAKLNLAHFTLPGRVLGTPAYMAPEQLSGEGVDGRSDLFSLGVILYAMVTGHSPFQGDSATTVCFKVANREPVAASALNLNLPGKLDAVIARAMAKNREKRYQRGSEFAEDLRQLRTGGVPGATTLPQMKPTETARKAGLVRGLKGRPAVGLAYAAKVIRAEFLKSPAKDLMLGVATVVLLLIVGVQSKLLVRTHDEGESANDSSRTLAAQSQAGGGTTAGVAVNGASPAKAAASAGARIAAAKSAGKDSAGIGAGVHSVKEVVVPLSTVELAVRHQFKDATLYVWVDDKLALARLLHGGVQKKLVVFGQVRGVESETLKVPAGKHVLRFRTRTADQTVDLSKTLTAEFVGGADKTLQITFDKHNSAMRLEWQ